jgi:hypothetical protein
LPSRNSVANLQPKREPGCALGRGGYRLGDGLGDGLRDGLGRADGDGDAEGPGLAAWLPCAAF